VTRAADDHGEALLAAVNDALADVDLPARPCAIDPAETALVYVVGVPRSGTTLLAQLIARHLDVGCISNLAARFWRRPRVGLEIARMVLGDARGTIALRSTHGATPGAAAPHEFGNFWRHWLRLDAMPNHRGPATHHATLDADGLRDALRDEIIATVGGPVMLRNVICGLHARFLTTVHPRSLFVRVERDERPVAASILTARHTRTGTYDAWWSLAPSTYPFSDLGVDPVADVVRQVRDCGADFDDELGAPEVHAMTIGYDALCRDPRGALEAIATAASSLGGTVALVDEGPDPLAPSGGPDLPRALADRLDAALAG
jgi:LPS sulfotransferase NodH